MTQLQLSNNLGQITEEINFYKQQAGLSLFEIGKRVKHVKENDLAHGQFGSWVESLGFSSKHAYKYIQAYEQFSPTSGNLGASKILEMLSLPESIDRQDFIQQSHTIPSTGETKTVDEMTVKELREVKKQLQEVQRKAAEAEAKATTAQNTAQHWETKWRQEANKPPQVITKTETPPDYNELKEQARVAQQLNTEVVQLKRATESMRQTYEEKLSQQQKSDAAKRDLQKYLSEHLRSLTMNHDSAIFNYTAIQGDREAYDIVMRFLHQYENIVKQQFAEWQKLTTIRAVN